ncbi:hypothetical protein HK405_004199 [Cladochytrium tenue]|nr:hypothetical protein HK405_004199 [Cladochytrium tenue]
MGDGSDLRLRPSGSFHGPGSPAPAPPALSLSSSSRGASPHSTVAPSSAVAATSPLPSLQSAVAKPEATTSDATLLAVREKLARLRAARSALSQALSQEPQHKAACEQETGEPRSSTSPTFTASTARPSASPPSAPPRKTSAGISIRPLAAPTHLTLGDSRPANNAVVGSSSSCPPHPPSLGSGMDSRRATARQHATNSSLLPSDSMSSSSSPNPYGQSPDSDGLQNIEVLASQLDSVASLVDEVAGQAHQFGGALPTTEELASADAVSDSGATIGVAHPGFLRVVLPTSLPAGLPRALRDSLRSLDEVDTADVLEAVNLMLDDLDRRVSLINKITSDLGVPATPASGASDGGRPSTAYLSTTPFPNNSAAPPTAASSSSAPQLLSSSLSSSAMTTQQTAAIDSFPSPAATVGSFSPRGAGLRPGSGSDTSTRGLRIPSHAEPFSPLLIHDWPPLANIVGLAANPAYQLLHRLHLNRGPVIAIRDAGPPPRPPPAFPVPPAPGPPPPLLRASSSPGIASMLPQPPTLPAALPPHPDPSLSDGGGGDISGGDAGSHRRTASGGWGSYRAVDLHRSGSLNAGSSSVWMTVDGANMPAVPHGQPVKRRSKDVIVSARGGGMQFSSSIATPHMVAGTNAAEADALRRQLEVLGAADGAVVGANDSRRQAFHDQWLMVQQQHQQYGEFDQQQQQLHEFTGERKDLSVPVASPPAVGHSQTSRGRLPATSAPAPFPAPRQRSLDGFGSRSPSAGFHHLHAVPLHAAFPVQSWTQIADSGAPYVLAGGGGGAAVLSVPDASVISTPPLALPSTFGSHAFAAGAGPEAYMLSAAPPSIGGDQHLAAWLPPPRRPPSQYLSAPAEFNQVLVRHPLDQRQPPPPHSPQQQPLATPRPPAVVQQGRSMSGRGGGGNAGLQHKRFSMFGMSRA